MKATLQGYMAKRRTAPAPGFDVPGVQWICSASSCLAAAPEGWIERWEHNTDTWLYDTEQAALAALPAGDEGLFELFAYALYPVRFLDGARHEHAPHDPALPALSPRFERLGFDAFSSTYGACADCSPLSCNRAAATLGANRDCLFDTLEAALAGAQLFSSGGWEPGIYLVTEVWRRGQ